MPEPEDSRDVDSDVTKRAQQNKLSLRARHLAALPFQHPSAGTLVYSFFAGILASLGAQLLTTPLLNLAPDLCTTTLLTAAFLLFISAGAMIWIAFEIESFKEEWIKGGRPPLGSDRRLLILEKRGIEHTGTDAPRKLPSRLWRLWVLLGISIVLCLDAVFLIWIS